jgi:hypothetical protein
VCIQGAGYEVFGICADNNGKAGPAAVHVKELEQHKATLVRTLKSADVVVCDLRDHHQASIWLLCQAAALSRSEPATFVAISDPLVWGCTDAAAIESEMVGKALTPTVEGSPGTCDGGPEQPATTQNETNDHAQQPEDAPEEKTDKSIVNDDREITQAEQLAQDIQPAQEILQNTREGFQLQGEHYSHRQPIPDMAHILRAENTILFRHQPARLRTYVVCPGVLYGNGECDRRFHDYFVCAWNATEATALQVFGNGDNTIPTIHVKDLSTYVLHVIKHLPEQRYLLAIDDSQCSQREIVTAISKYIGSGAVTDGLDTALYTQQVRPCTEVKETHCL